MPDRRMIAAVFAGGAAGTLLRAALSVAFPLPPSQWPWPTFVVNIAGAFLLGYFATRLQEVCRCRVTAGLLWARACAAG